MFLYCSLTKQFWGLGCLKLYYGAGVKSRSFFIGVVGVFQPRNPYQNATPQKMNCLQGVKFIVSLRIELAHRLGKVLAAFFLAKN